MIANQLLLNNKRILENLTKNLISQIWGLGYKKSYLYISVNIINIVKSSGW